MFLDTSNLRDEAICLRLHHTSEARPDIHWLPAYYFDICLLDGTKVGACDLRIGHNEKTYIGGNIGYNVDAPYRGRHYAARACALLFELARAHGMDHLFITCDPDNVPSARTCERTDGVYVETTDIPPENEMYLEGKRRVKIYRFDL